MFDNYAAMHTKIQFFGDFVVPSSTLVKMRNGPEQSLVNLDSNSNRLQQNMYFWNFAKLVDYFFLIFGKLQENLQKNSLRLANKVFVATLSRAALSDKSISSLEIFLFIACKSSRYSQKKSLPKFLAKVRGNCISRFVLRNSIRIFYRFSQNEVFNLCYRTMSLKCGLLCTSFLNSSVGKALEILGFNFTWCTVLFIQLIQNKNLEMFRAIPRKINSENFLDIQLLAIALANRCMYQTAQRKAKRCPRQLKVKLSAVPDSFESFLIIKSLQNPFSQ